MDIAVKICGLKRSEDVQACVDAGASYIGLNSYPNTPRYADPKTMRALAAGVPPGIAKVLLVVDATDDALMALLDTVPIDMIQLHGGESPARVSQVKSLTGLPVMKALGISTQDDVTRIHDYARVADQLLLDAKPPKGADRPGGNAVSFDWSLLRGADIAVPWMLAGGLSVDNVADAIAMSGARQVDVSSGVESAPGIKDADLIRRFVAQTQRA